MPDFNHGPDNALLSIGLSEEKIAELTLTQRDFIIGHEVMCEIILGARGRVVKITMTFDADAVVDEGWNDIANKIESYGRDLADNTTRALGRWAVGETGYMDGQYNLPAIKLELL